MFKCLRIFEKTTPLSLYLQAKGIDFLKAYAMVQEINNCLKTFSRDFKETQNVSQNFVNWCD